MSKEKLNLTLLAKVWKLASSPNAGEAAAARHRAQAMVEKVGKTLADVPALLRGAEQAKAPQPGAGGFTFYDVTNPTHMAAYAERNRQRRAERAAKEAPARAEVLGRYGGSVDAVLAWTKEEQLLRDAVAQWSTFGEPPHQRWTRSIDGSSMHDFKPMPERVRQALSSAYALPRTIAAAFAEYEMWERRDNDLGLALEDTTDTHLDLPSYYRREIVRDLLETGLTATSLDEVIIRQRYSVDSQMSQPEIDKAVLRDLEALAEHEGRVAA